MRFLASDLFGFLERQGCEYDGEQFTLGEGWWGPQDQVFILPFPYERDGQLWFDAEPIEENLRDRWLGFTMPLNIPRYP